MAARTKIDLYELLPAAYRIDDAAQGYPLKALLDVISSQANLVREDIGGLWDDFFIETCAAWVIPYIGELVGNIPIFEAVRGRRADVAKTIYYRRRKGTLPMLEDLARDVTGWGAHAVAFFELLGWTQNLNHLRFEYAPSPRRRDPNAVDRVGAAHLRNLDAMDRLEGPFQITTHTVDVRRIRQTEGWYNIRNIGFFLWRLQAYRVLRGAARPSAASTYGFHLNPLGHPAPLFTHSLEELAENGLSTEAHVPGPIRPLAFHFDLKDHYEAASERSFLNPPADTRFYGAEASLVVEGRAPHEIVCADLSEWERPPAGFSGLLGAVVAFGGFTDPNPEITVTIGGEGPHVASIAAGAANLPDAAAALQAAIRGASAHRAFEGVRVLEMGSRLLVIPGVRGAGIALGTTAGDGISLDELGLDAAVPATGALSGELADFPTLTSSSLELAIRIGANGPHVITLGPAPVNTLALARARLEAAIQAADPAPAFTGAQVLIVEDRLLVLPGVAGETVVIRATAGDPMTAEQLKLAPRVGVDVRLGRLAFAIGDEPGDPPTVNYTYGFSANVGGGPYDRRRKPLRLGAVPPQNQREDTVLDPAALDTLIRVPGDAPSVSAALGLWNPAVHPRAVLQIDDSRTYFGNISINLTGRELVLQSANQERAVIIGDIDISAAGGQGCVTLSGLWVEGRVRVSGSLGELRLLDTTLVPGIRRSEQNEPSFPDSASLVADPSNDSLECGIDRSITGRLQIPEAVQRLTITDSIVDGVRQRGEAQIIPALVSGGLAPFPALSSAAPSFLLTAGDEGPHAVTLGAVPADLASARALLETAVRAAHTSEAFAAARVLAASDRLIILPGAPGELLIQPDGGDPTAQELRLDPPNSRSVFTLLSGPLTSFPAAGPGPLQFHLLAGEAGPISISIAAPPDLATARADLEAAVNAADPAAVFADARVLEVDGRLLVVPGGEHTALVFAAHPLDGESLLLLKLDSPRPALAGAPGGEAAGPELTVERTTFLGAVRVREFTLASEVIFDQRAYAVRRQAGCIRFSYVAPQSRTPRRYRCQPDLALENVVDAAEKALIRLRMRPLYSSRRYGDPGYAQLALNCACEIRTGAENGSEMGVFNELMQPQRETNLRIRLQEYLPFGLAPGLIYVT